MRKPVSPLVCATLAFALIATSAAAQVDLGPEPGQNSDGDEDRRLPLPPARPQLPLPAPRNAPPSQLQPEAKGPPAAPMPGVAQKGEPGMMGLPWPQSPEEVERTIQSLYAFLATSDDHRQAGEISAAIQRLWRLEGSDTVNLLIDRAEAFSQRMDQERALKLMDAAVDLEPDYAEAWSHRAYVRYRMNDYSAALGDLRRALALEPNHFRALDGMAKILDQLGEKKAALKAYQQLLAIHPNIEGGKESAEELKKAVEGQGI
jgi:tetratricopeptide (TPR) repeat protein